MMKKAILFLSLFFATSAFGQKSKIGYGVELDIIPLHMNNLTTNSPSSLSGFLGGFIDVNITNHFTAKASIGVHNIIFKNISLDKIPPSGNTTNLKRETQFWNTLEFKVEPRYYLFADTHNWGNLYAAIPLSIETAPFQKTYSNKPMFKAIPAIGYQYNLAYNWFFEANAGIGWSMIKYSSSGANHYADYLLGVRIGYKFK